MKRRVVLVGWSCLVLMFGLTGVAGAAEPGCSGNECPSNGAVPAPETAPEPLVPGEYQVLAAPNGAVSSSVGAGTYAADVEFSNNVVRPPMTTPLRTTLTATESSWDVEYTNDGLQALIATSSATTRRIAVIDNPTSSSPSYGTPISLAQFTGEGGAGYQPYSRAVDLTPDGSAGAVAIDSRGYVILTRSDSGAYVVDTAVQSPGLNEDGNPHAPGFLRDTSASMQTADGLVVGPARPDGTSLALARDASVIRVITGLGDERVPALGGLIDNPGLGNQQGGNGGMAFSPVDPEKAVVASLNGISVLLLDNPNAPVLTVQTPLNGINDGVSVAVMADGDTVVASDGDQLFFFDGLLDVDTSGEILEATAPPIDYGSSTVTAIEATSRNDVVVGLETLSNARIELVESVTTTPVPVPSAGAMLLSGDLATNSLGVFDGLDGYRFAARDGGIFNFGADPFLGSLGGLALNQPINGMAALPGASDGYWMSASDGGVFSFGGAGYYGSTGAMVLNRPIVGMARTPTGKGYWLVATDGGIFSFGDAVFHGSTGAMSLNEPIVGMAATATGLGYWLIARDGGVFSFGDATFHGSTGALKLNQPIVGGAATPSGNGYWFVATDGGIFSFGDAEFFGSTGALTLNQPIVSMLPTPNGQGYWLVASDGGVFSFGNAPFLGGTGAVSLNQPIFAASP